jgi:cell surface protein SprA
VEPPKINVFNEFVKVLMMTKNINFTYNETNGTMLPGFMPGADYFGMSKYQGMQWAPTLGFVFGSQEDIRLLAAERGWITQDSSLNNMFVQTNNKTLNLRATLEPIRDFRIELTANRQYSYRFQSLYRYDENLQDFVNLSPMETGNYNISFLTWATAFEKRPKRDSDYFSAAYEQFLANRQIMANRIALDRFGFITDSDGDGYPDGYGPTSREVLVPAFLAAYSGNDANNYTTSFFHKIPLPNWRINYDGLMKLKWFKNRFRTVTLSHSYRSTYTIGNYQTDLRFEDLDGDGFPDSFDDSNNYITQYQLSNVTISEQFAPLLKVDATLLNSFTARAEFKKDRNLGLSFANNQLTEIRGQEYVFGLGYRFKDVAFRVKSAGRSKKIVSDLNALADVSIRDNVTVNRNIADLVNTPTAGQRLITIKVTGDYIISQRFSVRIFYDRIVTKYEVSNTFPTANTNIGMSMRFSLGM